MVGWPCSRLHSCWLQKHTAFTVGGNIVHHFCRTLLSGAWLQASFSSLHHGAGTYKVVFCNPFKNNSQLMGVVTSKNSELSVTKVIDLKSQRKWLKNTFFFFPKRELEAGSCEPIWVVSGRPPLFCTVIPVIAMWGALLISSLYNVNVCADIHIFYCYNLLAHCIPVITMAISRHGLASNSPLLALQQRIEKYTITCKFKYACPLFWFNNEIWKVILKWQESPLK